PTRLLALVRPTGRIERGSMRLSRRICAIVQSGLRVRRLEPSSSENRRKSAMAQVNAVVLGAGIVGTSIALHLARCGLAVALIDRRAPGEETPYGNAGVIEGSMLLPPAFPSDFSSLLRIALKRAPEANYHLSFLPHVAS